MALINGLNKLIIRHRVSVVHTIAFLKSDYNYPSPHQNKFHDSINTKTGDKTDKLSQIHHPFAQTTFIGFIIFQPNYFLVKLFDK
jgi:hypothetical protein